MVGHIFAFILLYSKEIEFNVVIGSGAYPMVVLALLTRSTMGYRQS